jgi:outer membrane PBP1 activator LpoA protein
LGQAYQDDGQYELALASYLRLGETGTANAGVSLNVHNEIWDAITRFSPVQLDNFASTANSYQSRGWVELARVVSSEQYSIRSQLDAIRQWQRIWSQDNWNQQRDQWLTESSTEGELPDKLRSLAL